MTFILPINCIVFCSRAAKSKNHGNGNARAQRINSGLHRNKKQVWFICTRMVFSFWILVLSIPKVTENTTTIQYVSFHYIIHLFASTTNQEPDKTKNNNNLKHEYENKQTGLNQKKIFLCILHLTRKLWTGKLLLMLNTWGRQRPFIWTLYLLV